jgi:hypothetical protein
MNAKQYRFIFLGQIGATQGTFYAFNFYPGGVDNLIAHGISFLIFKHESTKE